MSTIYMSQLSTLPLMEMEGDQQDQGLFPAPFHVAKDPPILFPFMITNPVDQLQGQSSSYGDQHLRQHVLSEATQQFTDRMMMTGSEVFPTRPSPFRQTIQSIDGNMIQRSAYDPYHIENNKHITEGLCSGGWTASSSPPAKMKIMRRKATSSVYPEAGGAARKPTRRRPQAHQDAESQLLLQQAMGGVVRVCSDCSTTKTPLWRSGPCGPKSLCNACGIRQRKARRAMAAAASSGSGVPQAAATQQPKPAKKEKRPDVDRLSLPFKKRCKMVVVADHAAGGGATAATEATPPPPSPPETAAPTKDQADDHISGDDKEVINGDAATSPQSKIVAIPPPQAMSSFHAFPADEITDAAMLLMTLSCGFAPPKLAMASS